MDKMNRSSMDNYYRKNQQQMTIYSYWIDLLDSQRLGNYKLCHKIDIEWYMFLYQITERTYCQISCEPDYHRERLDDICRCGMIRKTLKRRHSEESAVTVFIAREPIEDIKYLLHYKYCQNAITRLHFNDFNQFVNSIILNQYRNSCSYAHNF